MKKVIAYSVCMLMVLSVAAAAPDSRLIKFFNETFPNAQNVKWNENKDEFSVSFTDANNNFEKVIYNKAGEFVCSWKYSEKDLPVNVMMALKKKYDDAVINGVTEYTSGKDVIYDVKLTKGTKWYCVKALADGTIASEKKYNNI